MNKCTNCNNCYCEKKIKKSLTEKNIKCQCEEKYNDRCNCGFENDPSVFPENYMYGQSYVPIQYINEIFKPEVGLKMGTIFPELVSPYNPGQNMDEIVYLKRMTENEGKCPQRE